MSTRESPQRLQLLEPMGERTVSLPCRLGGRISDDVRVPGASDSTAIVLRIVDEQLGVTAASDGGALINGAALPAGEFVGLCAGDVLSLGEALLVYEESATGPRLDVRHLVGNATVVPADATRARETHDNFADERIVAAHLDATERPEDSPGDGLAAGWFDLFRQRRSLLAAVVVVLCGFAVFALQLSRLEPVSITVRPAEAELSGTGFGWRSANTLLMLPGKRRIRAELEGYQPIERAVEVREDTPLSLELQLLPKPGVLEIDTAGVAARVFIDGAEVGQAPGAVNVAGGTRTLAIRAERYLDHVQTIEVQGRGVRQAVSVQLAPSWGTLEVSASTAGATLSIDGVPPIALPAKIDLPAGLHRLRIAAEGAREWQSAVLLKAGEVQRVGPIELGAPDARLRVTSMPAAADITVGGVFRGRTPAIVALPAGSDHDVVVSLQGYRSVDRKIFAAAGRELALAVTLQPVLAGLTIQGDPADAEVLVGGAVKGKTPLTVELPARRHTLELRKAGMQPERIEVDLSSAMARTVDYKLVPLGRARDWQPPPVASRAQSGTLLRLISGGTFTMGSGRREQGRRSNEFPRKVTLQRPFYLGTREVTNGEFRRFKSGHASGFVGKRTLDLDAQPVSKVSWNDAVEYCNWLSVQDGLPPAYQKKDGRWSLIEPVTTGYRLPTEAEWEFAARHAGVNAPTQRYEWGDALPPPAGIGNLAGAEAIDEMSRVLDGWQDDYPAVAPPGKFRANGFGIFDMTGNVSEWVHDAYVSFEANAGGTDPLGPAVGGTRRVFKGSNWRTVTFADLRAAWREGADEATQDIGFRVARYAE